MASTRLVRYREMRDFARTAEPPGNGKVVASEQLRFVIQKHAASHLHFDLRLEHDGTFRSWAVPKGPSLDPRDRRLAIEVEDHPLEYGDFEGTIPKDQYGGGTVMLWDRGYWAPEKGFEKIGQALDKGELKFVMEGERMHGSWVLVRTRREARGRASWMLIKHRDHEAAPGNFRAPSDRDRSAASGRTMADIARGKGKGAAPFMTSAGAAANAVWQSDRDQAAPAKRSKTAKPKRAARTKTVATLPDFIEPQLARPVARPPTGGGWAHEIKLDGYRMQLRVLRGKSTLRTRKGLDWSERFPEIVTSGSGLGDGIYDGEVVALDETGAPDFAALQAAVGDGHTKDLIYFVFDQLFDGIEDLRKLPLADRKARLRESLADADKAIRHVEHFVDPGAAVLRSACRMNLEGIVSKKLDARYQSGRVGTWTKCKCRAEHEVVIGAYTTTKGAFRSLIAGVNRNGRLVEVGRIGTGFGRHKMARILPRLQALETDKSAFSGKLSGRAAGEVHWVRPELVAEIEYEGFTADGLLRQAAFKGLREDKPAHEVETVEPAPASTEPKKAEPSTVRTPRIRTPMVRAPLVRTGGSAVVMDVTLSHAEKPLWPDAGDGRPVTKLDLAHYFEAVGDWLIRHVRGRPCSIIRFPDGIQGGGIEAEERFFQRHTGKGQSNLITTVRVRGDRQSYLQFDRVEALIAAAQMATLELHPWNSQPFAPEQPGRFVFDLDPAPDVPFEKVIGAAREIRDWLDDLGLLSFCKTTGGKGLHVVAPIEAKGVDWRTAKTFAMNVCKVMAADAPDRYLINMAKARREGR
ncbi:MAG: DNA ligase D, partial [Acetobacteraceae bacterium]